MQELWSLVQVRNAGSEARRVLLRSGLHLRALVQLSRFLRVHRREQEVTS